MRVKELLSSTTEYVNVYKENEKGRFLWWSNVLPSPMNKSDVECLVVEKVEIETMWYVDDEETFLCIIAREETPSESTRKVNVFIEEHLCKCVEIEVPNEMNKLDAMKYAERKAKQMYEDKEIILTADNFNGTCLMMVQDEDGNETGWFEF